eukprot:2541356-Rhodomonas_salina.1
MRRRVLGIKAFGGVSSFVSGLDPGMSCFRTATSRSSSLMLVSSSSASRRSLSTIVRDLSAVSPTSVVFRDSETRGPALVAPGAGICDAEDCVLHRLRWFGVLEISRADGGFTLIVIDESRSSQPRSPSRSPLASGSGSGSGSGAGSRERRWRCWSES